MRPSDTSLSFFDVPGSRYVRVLPRRREQGESSMSRLIGLCLAALVVATVGYFAVYFITFKVVLAECGC